MAMTTSAITMLELFKLVPSGFTLPLLLSLYSYPASLLAMAILPLKGPDPLLVYLGISHLSFGSWPSFFWHLGSTTVHSVSMLRRLGSLIFSSSSNSSSSLPGPSSMIDSEISPPPSGPELSSSSSVWQRFGSYGKRVLRKPLSWFYYT